MTIVTSDTMLILNSEQLARMTDQTAVGKDTGVLTLPHRFLNRETISYSINTHKIGVYS